MEEKFKKVYEKQQKLLKEKGYYIHNIIPDESSNLPKNIAYSHTHGLKENFKHPELEIVLNIDPKIINIIIDNVVAILKKENKKLKDEEMLKNVIAKYPVKIKHIIKDNDLICRIVLPDPNGMFPEDSNCIKPYSLQEQIFNKDNNREN